MEHDLRIVEVTCAEPQPEIVHDFAATVVEQYAPQVVTQTVFETVMQVPALAGIVFDKFVVLEEVVDSEGNLAGENEDAVTAEAVVELY